MKRCQVRMQSRKAKEEAGNTPKNETKLEHKEKKNGEN
jgi:hypothetical protein